MSTREDPEFNIVSQRFEYEDEEGQSWDQDPITKQWHPILTEEQIAAQQAAYSVPGVDESAPAKEARPKKRKANYTGAEETVEKKDERRPKSGSVYVQNLPLDVTTQELADIFSKCGILLEDAVTSEPRVKIYTNPDGTRKGDALIVYFREESVSLAIQMLDDTYIRDSRISVSKAEFEKKPQTEVKVDARKKRKGGALKARLNDWEDDDMNPLRQQQHMIDRAKHEKTVILKHMFSIAELEEDPALLLDLKEDVREECELLGQINSVALFDQEEDGVMTVSFKEYDSAVLCVKRMDGRYFAGRQVVAYISDGTDKFKKSKKGNDEDEDERLEQFGAWLEN